MFSSIKSQRWSVVSVIGALLVFGVWTIEARADWKAEWDKTVKAAKEEGKVVVYAGSRWDGVFDTFEKRFPEIKVTYVIGPADSNGQRIMAERRAGKPIADVSASAVSVTYNVLYKGNVFIPIGPELILPEVIDKSKWWGGKHKYLDDEDKYVFVFNAQAAPYFIYNTKLVDPRKLKSYWDILDPKWKGKIVMVDPTSSPAGNGLRFVFYNPDLGPKYLRRLLTEMEPQASRDARQIIDWLAVGKYAIGVFTNPSRLRVPAAKAQGLPIDSFATDHFKEGVLLASITGNVGILKHAPHPNAARVMVNWLLSRDGQLAYQKYVIADSLRIDISKDDVPVEIRRKEGVQYIVADTPDRLDLKPIRKVVNEVWRR